MFSRGNKLLLLALFASIALNIYLFALLPLSDRAATGQLAKSQASLPLSRSQLEMGLSDGVVSLDETATAFTAPEWAQLRDDLNYLFDGSEFDMAFAGVSAAASHYPRAAHALVDDWFAQTRKAVVADASRDNLQRAQRLLDATAGRYYSTLMYQWLQAELHFASDNDLAAIDLFVELGRNVDANVRAELQKRLFMAFSSRVSEFYRSEEWSEGLRLIDRVLWHRPDDGYSLLVKADFLIAQLRYADAESALQAALTVPAHRLNARKKLEELRLLMLGDSGIPLEPVSNSQFLVTTSVSPSGNSRASSARLLLDTGASLTVLRREYFERMPNARNAQFLRNAIMSTAGGRVEAPIYRVARFAVGPFQFDDFEVVVMDYPSQSSVGLLGMDFLGRFDFEIDQDNELLILSPKL